MKKILQLTNTITTQNGRTQVVINTFRQLHESHQFHFLVFESKEDNFFEEIYELGGEVFYSKEDVMSMLLTLKRVLVKEQYDVVEYHATSKWMLILPFIKYWSNAKIVIHAHSMSLGSSELSAKRNSVLAKFFHEKKAVNVAVSQKAGAGTFSNKKFKVVPNGIELDKYKFNTDERENIRSEFGIKRTDILLGNVGRHSTEKNQRFLLAVMKSLKGKGEYHLFLVGDGPDTVELKNLARIYGIEDKVHFLGMRRDVSRIYSALDIFVLPSLIEGLPTTVLEAAANGLPAMISDNVTSEVAMSGTKFISVSEGAEIKWAKSIINSTVKRPNDIVQSDIKNSNFNIENASKKWKMIYE